MDQRRPRMSNDTDVLWPPDVVEALNERQRNPRFHPYTCGNRSAPGHVEREGQDVGQLVATPQGWACPDCDYTQDWAHAVDMGT
jgi:hypothetical protein